MKKRKKNQSNKTLKKIKENNDLKSVEVDLFTNFVKDEVKCFSDPEVCSDHDDDPEEYRVIGFR